MKFFQFTTISRLQYVYIDAAFIIVIVSFYKMETVYFNIMCHLINLFAMKGRKKASKQLLSVIAFLSLNFRVLLFCALLCLYDGDLSPVLLT